MNFMRRNSSRSLFSLLTLATLLLSNAVLAQGGGPSYEDILAGFDDPERWLTYSGDYTGKRHSPLTQITPDNVDQLRPVWTFQTGTTTRGRGFETTPLRRWCVVCYRLK